MTVKFVDYSITHCFDAHTNKQYYRLTHWFSYIDTPHIVLKEGNTNDLISYDEAIDKHRNITTEEG